MPLNQLGASASLATAAAYGRRGKRKGGRAAGAGRGGAQAGNSVFFWSPSRPLPPPGEVVGVLSRSPPPAWFAEAAYTLLLYDELLEWSDRPLREFLAYPLQTEWQRKEHLHLAIIQNFDRGKVSAGAGGAGGAGALVSGPRVAAPPPGVVKEGGLGFTEDGRRVRVDEPGAACGTH